MKKTIISFCLLFTGVIQLHSQNNVSVSLTQNEAETLLLKNNLGLLAKQLELDIADAEVIQAKVWPNPSLTVDEVNIWATSYQKRTGEQLPGLFGNAEFGRYRQVAAQLEQLVELAGKRKKRIAIAEVTKQMANAYLEDFLLSLRTEFRETLYEFEYNKRYVELLQKQSSSLEILINAFKEQFKENNVSKVDLIRLQATNFNLKNEIIDTQESLNAQQQNLLVLLNLSDDTSLRFSDVFDDNFPYQIDLNTLQTETLQQKAIELHPLLKATNLAVDKAEKNLILEKAQRTPDITFSVGYDRGGNIMQDFIGFGASIDLPIFDRNKGGIKKASFEISQAQYEQQETELYIKTKVREKVTNLEQISNFFTTVTPQYILDLDSSMEAYNQFFKDQTINMVTYLDFMEAYIENMQILYENQQQYYNALEELNYITGMNIQHTKN